MIAHGHAVPEPSTISAPFFFFSNNEVSDILFVSPSIEDVLGFKPEQVVGQKYTDFIKTDDSLNHDMEECRVRRFDGDGNHESLRAVRSINGEIKVLRIQTCGRINEKGEIVANHGVAVDVTDAYYKEREMLERFDVLNAHNDQLSSRERQVLDMVVEGRPNKSIAKRLEISERGVENIRARLFKKFAVNSSAELVSKAKELEVLEEIMVLSHCGPSRF